MLTRDRRREIEVPVEHNPIEKLENLPVPGTVTIVLVTDGKAVIALNGEAMTVPAPCALCLNESDTVRVIDNGGLFAQSLSVSPSFPVNPEQLELFANTRDGQNALSLFYARDNCYSGLIMLPPRVYARVFEWMSVIGTEINAQSDGRWTCRVRAYFLRMINLLNSVSVERQTAELAAGTPVDAVMEYIHANYMDEITLETLCRFAKSNRTTLGRSFRERAGQTVMGYLANYRLRTATELLAHTGLTIDEVARKTGFSRDTYLIRRFIKCKGLTPTEYRQSVRKAHSIVIGKSI